MKTYKVHTLSELSLWSDCDNPENRVNEEMITDSVIFKYSADGSEYININIRSSDKEDPKGINASIRFDVDSMEHLHSWLGTLLKNKVLITTPQSDEPFEEFKEISR